ncbi:naa20 [Ecytonucleospora hepatopenaei]|uniref:Naa20 n=1 Tax=Ecytonucleospora hepatopenaei TaxID=646526 RepID=A0A1W0E523_9MICR|nr:naa20 [Ecytonucleospora hepatopenaei]
MFTFDKFLPENIFQMDMCNLDGFTENFTLDYYLEHMLHNKNIPFYCTKIFDCNFSGGLEYVNNLTNSSNTIYGYIFGYKTTKHLSLEDDREYSTKQYKLKGHQIFSLSVSFITRRTGIGSELLKFMHYLEGDFLKLFVREDNQNAICFYYKHGFEIRRKIYGYYDSPNADALEMVKVKDGAIKSERNIYSHQMNDSD